VGLTDLQIKKLAPKKGRYEVPDRQGLYVRVVPSGTEA
jgi:hypothetical protein